MQLTKVSQRCIATSNLTLPDTIVATWTTTHTELTFWLTPERVQVDATLSVAVVGEGDVPPLVLDGVELELLSLTVNNVTRDLGHVHVDQRSLTIDLEGARSASIATSVLVQLRQPSALGLVAQPGLFNTHLEPTGLRRVTYCIDQPHSRSTHVLHLIADPVQYPVTVASGTLTSEGKHQGGLWRRTFTDEVPMSSYLISVIAGDFSSRRQSIEIAGQHLDLQILGAAHLIDGADLAFAIATSTLDWDQRHGGIAFDLPTLSMAAIAAYPDATEYHGLMQFAPSALLLDPRGFTDDDALPIISNVSHELLHHTRGNRITVSSWDQLALKEGLTVLAQGEVRAELEGPSARLLEVAFLRRVQYPEEVTLAQPVVRSDSPASSEVYNRTTYLKGAEIFRMLHHLVGKEATDDARVLFNLRFDLGSATVADYLNCLVEAAPEHKDELIAVARWFTLVGRPALLATLTTTAQGSTLTLERSDQLKDDPLVLIPVTVSVVDPIHGQVSSTLDGNSQPAHVVLLRERTCTVNLSHEHGAVVSLLEGCSAPVDLTTNHDDHSLAILVKRADDPYARFQAAETLKTLVIDQLRSASPDQAGATLDVLSSALEFALESEHDKSVLAWLLSLPSEQTLSDHDAVIDVDGIHLGVTRLAHRLGHDLGDLLVPLVTTVTAAATSLTASARAERQLADAALGLLAARGLDRDLDLVASVIRSDDATRAARALSHGAAANHPDLDALLDETLGKWHEAPLLLDRWIRAQSGAPHAATIDRIRRIVTSPVYDRTERSRVMAVWFPFTTQNRVAFHHVTGRGYEAFIDEVEHLANSQPDAVLRLVPDLLQFKRFDPVRQALIRTQLERVRAFHGLGPFALSILDDLLSSP